MPRRVYIRKRIFYSGINKQNLKPNRLQVEHLFYSRVLKYLVTTSVDEQLVYLLNLNKILCTHE